jgi:uncharacterized protein YbaP (TraB family)
MVPLLALVACLLTGRAAADELAHGQGLLWRITGADSAASYVFGTIHSDDPAVLDLTAPVEQAFTEAERYAFELDFSQDVQARMGRAMVDRSPPPLRERLDAATWEQARAAAEQRGLPAKALSVLEPWALAISLAVPPIQPAQSLDRVLSRRARERGAPTTGLETVDEQIAVFDSMAIAHQLELLRGVLDLIDRDALAPMFERLRAAWLREDLAAIVAVSEANPMLATPTAEAEFTQRLIEQRNRRMAQRMQPLLDKGGAFIAIGALHLPGDSGVLRRLEKAGYTVERVR